MNKNIKHLFLLVTLAVLLTGLTVISASDVSDNITVDSSVSHVTTQSAGNVESVQSTDNKIDKKVQSKTSKNKQKALNQTIKDNIVQKENITFSENKSMINRIEYKNYNDKKIKMLEENVTISVNNFEELKNVLYNTTANNLTINLNDPYDPLNIESNQTYIVTNILRSNAFKSKNVTINGNNQIIDCNNQMFLYSMPIGTNKEITLTNLTILNGNGGNIAPINVYGTLNLINVTLTDCIGGQGAISVNQGTTTLINCTISNNNKTYFKSYGALYNDGNLIVSNCYIPGLLVNRVLEN